MHYDLVNKKLEGAQLALSIKVIAGKLPLRKVLRTKCRRAKDTVTTPTKVSNNCGRAG